MEDGEVTTEDERTVELSTIASIYPELVIDSRQPYFATLEVPVTPIEPLQIFFRSTADSAPLNLPNHPNSSGRSHTSTTTTSSNVQQSTSTVEVHQLSHLPPLTLKISLPPGYPNDTPPLVTLSTSPPWLPRRVVRDLQRDCGKLWEELGRDLVLYAYIDHLQQAAANAFSVDSQDNAFHLPSDLRLVLLDFDLRTKRGIFERETFDCGICLEPKKGVQCHRLSLCSHVFCTSCLQALFNGAIKEGDVDTVKCPDPGCGKDHRRIEQPTPDSVKKRKRQDRTLNPSELLQVPLTAETVQRYVRLKRKKRLEADKNTIYCPRQWCQGAARSKKYPKPTSTLDDIVDFPSDTEDDESPNRATVLKDTPQKIPMGERLALCEDCEYAFCIVCQKGWHGTGGGSLSICNPRRKQELKEEEKASETYLKSFTTPCPTCSAPCQKTMGCNHMICFKCRTHFCYLCSSYLMPENPYKHFNTVDSPCYMRLWELEGGDGAEMGDGAARVRPGWEEESDEEEDPTDWDEEFVNLGAEVEEADTDDEEPAPDQRRPERNMQVEIINFARDGARNQRIIHNIPERPRNVNPPQPPPPAAPAPPRRHNRPQRVLGGHQQQANHQRRAQQEPHRAVAPLNARAQHPPRPRPDNVHNAVPAQAVIPPNNAGPIVAHNALEGAEEAPPAVFPHAAPGQGNNVAAGLDRFLALAEADQEDEWDSDEIDDDIDFGVGGGGDREIGGRAAGADMVHRRANLDPQVQGMQRMERRWRGLGFR